MCAGHARELVKCHDMVRKNALVVNCNILYDVDILYWYSFFGRPCSNDQLSIFKQPPANNQVKWIIKLEIDACGWQ